jgi:diguanylate cyclase (GGDEF)-like protein/PAS domain S-box-containing protein
MLAVTYVTYRRVAGPVVRLARAVRANVDTAAGTRAPIEVRGPAEVRAVADEFNLLLDEVQWELLERRRAEALAQSSAHTYRRLFEDNPNPMAIWDYETYRFLAVNDAMVEHYGYSHAEFLDMRVLDIVEPAPDTTYEDLRHSLDDHKSAGTVHHSGPFRHVTKDGTRIAIEVTSHTFDFNGREARFTQITDITQRLEHERHLQHLAVYDDLTGLPNRTLLLDRLGLALLAARRNDAMLGLLFVDLDRFKLVNNAHGRDAGDELLRAVGDRLRASLRAGDTLARVSGNEFAVLCPELADETEAVSVTGRIEGMLAAPFELEVGPVFVTASVGVALSRGFDQAEDLLRNADAAVHRAKERGGSRYEIFDENIRRRTLKRLETSIELRRALECDELRVHYQPTFDLTDGACVGAEALIRWQHPTRGLLPPAEFIGVAEETGLIAPIGNWVLRTACRQVAAWRADGSGPTSVSVNLSARELTQPDLVTLVSEALDMAGVAADALCLEITETSLVDDPDASISVLASLRALGVRLSIDDFGTGYSSLLYLRRYDADYLKIDRSFVAGLGMNPQDDAIVRTTIDLAHVFGMAVVAEGVETHQQAHGLRVRGCDLAQGYLWSRPVPAAELPRMTVRDAARRTAPSDARATKPAASAEERA